VLSDDSTYEIFLPLTLVGAISGMEDPAPAIAKAAFNTADEGDRVSEGWGLAELFGSIGQQLETENYLSLLSFQGISLDMLLSGIANTLDILVDPDGIAYDTLPVVNKSLMELIGGKDEIQVVSVDGAPNGGTFTLALDGETSADIAYDADGAEVETALEGLSKLMDVTVTGGSGAPWVIQFNGPAAKNFPELVVDDTNVAGGSIVFQLTAQEGGNALDNIKTGIDDLRATLSDIQSLERDLNFMFSDAIGIDFGLGDQAEVEDAAAALAGLAFGLDGSSSDGDLAVALAEEALPELLAELQQFRDALFASETLAELGLDVTATDTDIAVAIADADELADLQAARDLVVTNVEFVVSLLVMEFYGLDAEASNAEITAAFDNSEEVAYAKQARDLLKNTPAGTSQFDLDFADNFLDSRGLDEDSTDGEIATALSKADLIAEVKAARDVVVAADAELKAAYAALVGLELDGFSDDFALASAIIDADQYTTLTDARGVLASFGIDLGAAAAGLGALGLDSSASDGDIALALVDGDLQLTADLADYIVERDIMAGYEANRIVILTYENSTLTAEIVFEQIFTDDVSFSLDLQDLVDKIPAGATKDAVAALIGDGGAIDVEASGGLGLEAFARFDLGFGFDLSNLLDPSLFVTDATGITLGLDVFETEPLNFEAGGGSPLHRAEPGRAVPRAARL